MIPMSFIGARSRTWKSVIKFDGSVEEMIKHYNSINFREDWYTDQTLISTALLDSGLCSVSPVNGSVQDKKTCWHGSKIFANCNIHNKFENCLWWHFSSSEVVSDMEEKYQEILNNTNIPRLPEKYDYDYVY